MIDKEARTIWAFFAGMVAANSILIGLMVASYSPVIGLLKTMPYLPTALAGIGCLVCLVWWLLTARTRAFYDYYTSCAAVYEKEAYLEAVRMIRDADIIAFGGKASIPKLTPKVDPNTLEVKVKESVLRVTGLSKTKGKYMIYGIISLFVVIYGFGGAIICIYPGIANSKEETKDAILQRIVRPTTNAGISTTSTAIHRKQHTETYKDFKVGDIRTYPMECPVTTAMKAVSGGAISTNPNIILQGTQIKLDTYTPIFVKESGKIYVTVRRVAPEVGSDPTTKPLDVTFWSACVD